MQRFSSFLRELRRRRVYRTAALYCAGAFVVLQATDLLLQGLGLPTWILTLVIALAVLGLFPTLALSWAFDLTPAGIRRDPPSLDGMVVPWGRAAVAAGLLVLVGAGGFSAYLRVRASPSSSPPSIAVLPFADLGGDARDEYLRDGLTEDVLTQLAKVAGLRVISRTSVMQYKGTAKGIPEIAGELGVTHVLEGSVRRTDDRIRISAQLIDGHTNQHIWAETYDRRLSDVFDIQADIARRIAAALQVSLTRREEERVARTPTADPEAYDLYLRAREYLYRFEREANEVAIQLGRMATAKDPELAPAHALLGTALAFKVRMGEGLEWADSALVEGQRAIALDPDLADGHLARGNALLRMGRYVEARNAYDRAAELNPSDWRAAVNLAVVHSYQGHPVESLRWTRRAIEMAPRSPLMAVAWRNMAAYYLDLSLPDLAEEALSVAVGEGQPDHPGVRTMQIGIALERGDLDRARALGDTLATDAPTDPSAHLLAGDAYLFAGDLDVARLHYETAYALAPRAEGVRHFAPTLLGYVLWHTGERGRAAQLFDSMESMALTEIGKGRDNYTLHLSLAAISATRGDTATALLRLEQAIASGGVVTEWALASDPLFEPVRNTPRYRALRAELGARGDAMRRQALAESPPSSLGRRAPRPRPWSATGAD